MAGAAAFLCFSLLCLCSRALASSPPPATSSNATTAGDELALLSFKSMVSSSDDPSSSLLASWNTSVHYCSWPGVICGRRRHRERVVALRLGSAGLSGRVSPFLGNLSFLRELDLGDNRLTGQVPTDLGRLAKLRQLNLSANSFHGSITAAALRRCTRLVALDLSSNQLHGEIPAEIGELGLNNLVYLYLQENDFSGEIPPSVAMLPSIEVLCLYSNRFSGDVPPSLGNLSSLRYLYLDNNTLSGAIPATLGALPCLSWLTLGFNNLTGEIPSSVWNISSLRRLSVQRNMLTGAMPPAAVSGLPRLETIAMDHNQFHGDIPASLANASGLSMVSLGANAFGGVVPAEIGKLANLRLLQLAETMIQAEDPEDWEFMSALRNCSRLWFLGLNACKLGGVLPDSLSNLSSSLELISVSHNAIAGTIPRGIGNLFSISSLGLSYNYFTGDIPSSFGMLANLQDLTICNNRMNGLVPATIGNLTELNYLYLEANAFSGRIPSTIGNLTKLLEMNISSNNLAGPIPTGLLNIPTLSTFLDISNNKLEGRIPQEIGNLKNLVEFNAESNKLSGEIPAALGDSQLLQNVYLQNNFLSGSIPSALSQLKGLENLDLSNNQLSGEIPRWLGNISMLNYLNLSFNNFSGEVPNIGVFTNSTAVSIQGNGKLCGGVPTLHLPPCSSDLPEKKRRFLLIPTVIIPLVAILVIVMLLYKFLTRRKKNRTKTPSTTSMQGHPFISYSQLAKATEGFSTNNLLGSGTFGSVYKGKFDGQTDESTEFVAVKVLKLQTPGALKSFAAECEALRNLRHRNLVKIVTACSSIDARGYDFKAIIFDFMPNGSLEGWLHPSTEDQIEMKYLSLLQRVTILLDVAYALDYLHCHSPAPVVHCDIKSSNVLLDADMVAHIGDFGLAKILTEGNSSLQESTSSMGFRGTIGYAAPEYGAGNMVSTEGDIYSYGILVLETVTRKRPTDDRFRNGLSLREYVELALHDKTMDIVDTQLTLEQENNGWETLDDYSYKRKIDCLFSLLRIGISCSHELPLSRMRTTDVVSELQAIRESLLRECRTEDGGYVSVTLE